MASINAPLMRVSVARNSVSVASGERFPSGYVGSIGVVKSVMALVFQGCISWIKIAAILRLSPLNFANDFTA